MKKKILFIYRYSALEEVLKNPHTNPTEFLWGMNWVDKEKYDITWINVPHTGKRTGWRRVSRLPEFFFARLTRLGLPLEIYWLFKKQLKEADELVCVNDQITLSILCWKLFGFLKRQKVHGIVMSLPERLKYFKQHHWLIAMLSRMLNKATTIFNLSNYVQDHFIKDFSIHESTQVKTLYFGIDVDFWKQQEGVQSNFVLSIGNDMNRDFKTLIEAIPQTQTLKIVSNKKAELGTKDVEFITGLTNDQVREKYNQALFVVIPSIKLDKESSGLSSCLQAMACKKAVIISDAPPLRELFKDYEHCLFYVSEDVVSLQEKITLLLSNPMLCNRLAEASYALVQERFTCKQMGKMIESTLL